MGERIRALRQGRKRDDGSELSQHELGIAVGALGNQVSKWELGKANPTVENVRRLADYFGVTTDYIITGKGGS